MSRSDIFPKDQNINIVRNPLCAIVLMVYDNDEDCLYYYRVCSDYMWFHATYALFLNFKSAFFDRGPIINRLSRKKDTREIVCN